MAQSVDFKINGIDEITKGLDKLEATFATDIVKQALVKGMNPIEDEIKRNAVFGPNSDGTIRDSVRFVPGKSKNGSIQAVLRVGSEDETNKAYVAAFIEYGYTHPKSHEEIPPQPFIRPAFESKGQETIDMTIAELKTALKAEGVI